MVFHVLWNIKSLILRARFTNSWLYFAVKIVGYRQDLLKTFSEELELKMCGHRCAWRYWICICRVLKWITQCNFLTFALVFAPLFNGPKKHVLKQAVIWIWLLFLFCCIFLKWSVAKYGDSVLHLTHPSAHTVVNTHTMNTHSSAHTQ